MQKQLKPFSDTGRIIAPPLKEYREIRGKDEIHIAIYCIENNYYYAVNCKLGLFVRAAYPHPTTPPLPTLTAARAAACEEVKQWVKQNRPAKKRAKLFSVLEYRQLEFSF